MRNRHHLMHERASFKAPDAKDLKNHPLMVVRMDIGVHDDYHARHFGLTKQPHIMIVGSVLESLDAIMPEEPNPEHVAEYIAYSLGTLSLMDHRKDIQRSAQNMQQLLLNQIPYLISGHARYDK